ncbi:DUF6174 domain-containing protein [Streptomyces sp. NPDC005263]|uniref:DUF6174 domain-containing protein n=1 Tax=Streptomyces sp. NPDC005263 TaxID=3364711 RepID=UPI0036C8109F
MTAVRSPARFTSAALLLVGLAGLLGSTAACGNEAATPPGSEAEPAPMTVEPHSESSWEEPASYAYTLTSSEGERALIGAFRVTVRDGAVAEAVGLDDSGRRVVRRLPDEVPTLGRLLDELKRARHDKADVAEARYAADGHPVRIFLDWETNAVDDEALYVVSAYEVARKQRHR